MESAKLILDLTSFFVQTVKRIIEAVGELCTEYDAASLEEFVAAQMRALGAVVFEYCWALRCREDGRPASVECPCGRRRVFKGRAERAIRTTLGEMNLAERFRYRCPSCGAETILGDELKGGGDLSELAERLLACAGQAVVYGEVYVVGDVFWLVGASVGADVLTARRRSPQAARSNGAGRLHKGGCTRRTEGA